MGGKKRMRKRKNKGKRRKTQTMHHAMSSRVCPEQA